MRESCLISIIIPVYNVENYLRVCLDSVRNQDFKDYEVILVDDGSTDNSGKICDEYAQKYPFVSVIHKQNGGASASRNVGLKSAKGKYILFIDSDDYIEKNSIDKVVASVNECDYPIDIMFLEASKIFPDGRVESLGDGYIKQQINAQEKSVVMNHIASLPKYPGSPCTKLINRKLIIDNNIFFTEGMIAEDIDWTIRLLIKAEKFAYCDSQYYYYRQGRVGSVTNTAGQRGVVCLLDIIKKWSSEQSGEKYQNQINAFLAYEYMILLLNYAGLNKNVKKEYIKDLKKYLWILKYGKTLKIKLVRIFTGLVGINFTAFLLKVVYK